MKKIKLSQFTVPPTGLVENGSFQESWPPSTSTFSWKKMKPSPTPNSVPKPTRFNPTNRSPAEAKVSSVIPVSSVQKGVKGVLRGSYQRKRFPQGQDGFQPFEIRNGWLLALKKRLVYRYIYIYAVYDYICIQVSIYVYDISQSMH